MQSDRIINDFRMGFRLQSYETGQSFYSRLGHLFSVHNRLLFEKYQEAVISTARWKRGNVSPEQLERTETIYCRLQAQLVGLRSFADAYPCIRYEIEPFIEQRAKDLFHLDNLIRSRLGRDLYALSERYALSENGRPASAKQIPLLSLMDTDNAQKANLLHILAYRIQLERLIGYLAYSSSIYPDTADSSMTEISKVCDTIDSLDSMIDTMQHQRPPNP